MESIEEMKTDIHFKHFILDGVDIHEDLMSTTANCIAQRTGSIQNWLAWVMKLKKRKFSLLWAKIT